jgi:hypothetical protein
MLEEKSMEALKGSLPELLQKCDEETSEQKEILVRLESEGAQTKLQAEKDRQQSVKDERQKKITEVMGTDAFKAAEQESIVEKMLKLCSNELPKECEIYNLLGCKKQHLEMIDKLIETDFKEVVSVEDSVKLKSEQAKCKQYLSEITQFDISDLNKSYQDTFKQLLGEYASQTLLEILDNSDLAVVAPILLEN